MASSYEPLLSSPIGKKTSLPCRALLVALSLAAVICLTSFVALRLSTTTNTISLRPSDLCTNSPSPSSCHVIVADILTLSTPKPTPLHVFNSLVTKSLHQIDSIELELNRSNNYDQSAALADCAQLMDLSRDRLTDSITAVATGAHTNARTWLSAVLTNHATCRDGLSGPTTNSNLESQLKVLMDQASATLAVLNAVDSSTASQRDEAINRPVLGFPAWMSFRDRKLLEASGDGITANVVVAKDGSGKYKKVQDAVDSAPDKGTARYVIYVKKGFYKENVIIGKKKTNVMIVGDGMDDTVISGSLNFVDGTSTYNTATLGEV